MAGDWSEAYPYGAGLCVRRGVMAEVQRRTTACGLRQSLGRKGQLLLSGEDYDINLTACDMGLGCGVFQALKLTHLIPARRLTADYMLKLCYGTRLFQRVAVHRPREAPVRPAADSVQASPLESPAPPPTISAAGLHLGGSDRHPRRSSVLPEEPDHRNLHPRFCQIVGAAPQEHRAYIMV